MYIQHHWWYAYSKDLWDHQLYNLKKNLKKKLLNSYFNYLQWKTWFCIFFGYNMYNNLEFLQVLFAKAATTLQLGGVIRFWVPGVTNRSSKQSPHRLLCTFSRTTHSSYIVQKLYKPLFYLTSYSCRRHMWHTHRSGSYRWCRTWSKSQNS